MLSIISSDCCGMDYIHGISAYQNNSAEAMREFLFRVGSQNRYSGRQSYRLVGLYVFTGVVKRRLRSDRPTYGQQFANFIKKHKLGNVTEGAQRLNPNSGNTIQAWIWAPSQAGLKKWVAADTKKKD